MKKRDYAGEPPRAAAEESGYSVYVHRTPERKVYVGMTRVDPRKRWNYGNGYNPESDFGKAIAKYGWNGIEHEVVVCGITKQEAATLEAYLIKLAGDRCYNTVHKFYSTASRDKLDKFLSSANVKDVFGFDPDWAPAELTVNTFVGLADEKDTKPDKSMKKEKTKSVPVARTKTIGGVKISLILDKRYRQQDGLYGVKIRIYHHRKYKYISTGWSMTQKEFEDMNEGTERCLGRDFEKACDLVRKALGEDRFHINSFELDGELREKPTMTLCDLLEKRSELAERLPTKNLYLNSSRIVRRCFEDGLPIELLSVKSVERIFAKMDELGYSGTSKHFLASNLRAAIQFGIYKGWVKEWQYPFRRKAYELDKIPIPRHAKRSDNHISLDEVRMLFSHFCETRDRALLYFLFSYLTGGMNLADMMELRFGEDFLSDEAFKYRRRKTRGRNNFVTIIPFHRLIKDLFKEAGIVPEEGKAVFPEFACSESEYYKVKGNIASSVNSKLKRVAKKAGLDKDVSLTTARHTFATVANKTGMPYSMAEAAMGHVNSGVSSHYIGAWNAAEMTPYFERLL